MSLRDYLNSVKGAKNHLTQTAREDDHFSAQRSKISVSGMSRWKGNQV